MTTLAQAVDWYPKHLRWKHGLRLRELDWKLFETPKLLLALHDALHRTTLCDHDARDVRY